MDVQACYTELLIACKLSKHQIHPKQSSNRRHIGCDRVTFLALLTFLVSGMRQANHDAAALEGTAVEGQGFLRLDFWSHRYSMKQSTSALRAVSGLKEIFEKQFGALGKCMKMHDVGAQPAMYMILSFAMAKKIPHYIIAASQ